MTNTFQIHVWKLHSRICCIIHSFCFDTLLRKEGYQPTAGTVTTVSAGPPPPDHIYRMTTTIRISSPSMVLMMLITTTNLWIPIHAFVVQPFGTRTNAYISLVGPPSCPTSTIRSSTPRLLSTNPLARTMISSSISKIILWNRLKGKKSAEEEDEDWEPSEEDLMKDLEDLNLEDVDEDVDIEDNTIVMISDADDDDEVVDGDEDEEDEDEFDEDLDLWEEEDDEEEEEELVEEWVDEDGQQVGSYLGSEANYEDEEWEEDEGNSNIPLMDDPDDPDYMIQKQLVEETVARREQLKQDKEFDAVDFLMNRMTKEMSKAIEKTDYFKEAQKLEKEFIVIKEDDVKDLDLEKEMAATPDLMWDDPYENEGRSNILNTGLSDDDMERMDAAYKRVQKALSAEPWNKVDYKVEITDFASLSNQTIEEMDACLDEIQGSSYNVTRWLLYDLDFNVSNLILAAVKHNPQAPIIFQHWFPQLMTYSRYEHARERNFDFNWDDVANADIEELERYYLGFGYTEIPHKAPAETGIIGFDDLDEEELKMAAFENWMIEVYNPEWDRKDFDDDNFQDEDNVFSNFFEEPQHPDLPTFEDAQEDIRNWEDELDEGGEDNQEYREFMVKQRKYKYVEDAEFQKEFRGHLVVACTPTDDDVEIAEKITKRMREEFGKQVYVETRVLAHAREDDNVFEVWLESYEIDLLHSKKRASNSDKKWDGPAECDDAQIEYLVERVRFLISDEARFSYRFELDKEMAQ